MTVGRADLRPGRDEAAADAHQAAAVRRHERLQAARREALRERTDWCGGPAAGVVGEAMVALELGRPPHDKFGGDGMRDVLEAVVRLP